MSEKIRVAVLVGGDSSEREVSFKSGVAMAEALSPERYNVTLFDVATAETRAGAESTRALAMGARPRHAMLPVEWNQLTTTLYTMPFDAVLPAMHGGWGEDGTLQSLLDVAGIPYSGSTASASAIAINKQVCKAYMKDLGLNVPRGVLIASENALNDESAAWIFDSPVVVKPNEGGSSVGVTILKAPDEEKLHAAVQSALADGSAALVEQLIEGVEVTCATMGEGASTQALPLIEIVPQGDSAFYDYEAKYAPGGSQHLIPPRISEDASTLVAAAAIKAHRGLGCRGVARSDFIVDKNGTPYFLEINTIPGMTETSLVPDAARAAGTGFGKLVESLIDDTINRKR